MQKHHNNHIKTTNKKTNHKLKKNKPKTNTHNIPKIKTQFYKQQKTQTTILKQQQNLYIHFINIINIILSHYILLSINITN